jgi:aspartate/tyrosine/aromatic aminotransferase
MKMPPELLIPYPAVDGGQPFKDNVFNWVFQGYADEIRQTFKTYVCATPGGSGAIATVFRTHMSASEEVLVSDIRWQYDRFAEPAKIKLHSHTLFDGEHFNMASFKQEFDAMCSKQKRVIVIINDPCHNPSGYTLEMDEWKTILSLLNEKKHNEIILLYDIAYIDYSCEPDQRAKARELMTLEDNVNVIIAFSGSKTFGAYGMRMGAIIGLSRSDKWIAWSRENVYSLARGMWSATPTPAIELLNKMLTPEMKPDFIKGLIKARETIIARGKMFLTQAKEVNLPLIPYKNGFYTIVKCENSYEVFKKLTDHHIYGIPVAQGIRFALCSMPLKDIDGLAKRLKHIIFES